ncbi:LINE-1 retrotransposable element ORF2 protein [Linum grandiflorum]
MFDQATLHHEPIIGSDHAPLRLQLKGIQTRTHPPFRYDARWSEAAECSKIIKEIWRNENADHDKLGTARRKVSYWKRHNTVNASHRIKELRANLDQVQSLPQTANSREREAGILRELDEQWSQEEKFWKQTGKVNWLRLGDRNTKFFHASTIQRRTRNTISRLRTDTGTWITDWAGLKTHVQSFYKELFAKRAVVVHPNVSWDLPCVVSSDMNEALLRPVTPEEIRNATFSLGPDKSPGPDGFPGHFYRKFWDTIGPHFVEEIINFFRTGVMPEGWNETHIVLIPKVPNPEEVTQFRPISCCNFRYKIISKIMSSRLKPFIPDIISDMQTAFTGGRAIQDNIVIVHEVLHHFKTRRRSLKWDMMLKMDMKKAYDLVDWDCLDTILCRLGFFETWCSWIRACVRTVSFSVLLNGSPTDVFHPPRGIRQGDPISPFLFIILTNTLSHLIQKGMEGGSLKGLRLNARCPTLTHVLFADDTILFGEASVAEARNIISTMEQYGRLTGQEINFHKSRVTFSRNTPLALQNIVRTELGFLPDQDFGKYLGIPSDWGKCKKDMAAGILSRMENMGQSWKSLTLSHAGKETLLKAVIQAIPTYMMSCFLLPKKVTKRMNALVRAFFWGGSMTKKTIHWKAGRILSDSKGNGGLGFKDFRHFNLALLAKQGWRMLTEPDKLWTRVLKGLYFPSSSFLEAKKGSHPSWIWASLCDSREVLTLGARKNLMNGSSISVERDPWIPTLPGFRITPPRLTSSRPDEWMNQARDEWDPAKLRESFPDNVVDAITRIPIGPVHVGDEWIWHFNPRGNFTVRSAYHALRGPLPPYHPQQKWKWLWTLPIPPKIRFFLWRIAHDALATKRNLWRRQCAIDPVCSICNVEIEDLIHCLFQCTHARETWTKAFPSIPTPTGNDCCLSWILSNHQADAPFDTLLAVATLWHIWRARNERIFRNIAPVCDSTMFLAANSCAEWKSSSTLTPRNPPTTPLPPSPPPGQGPLQDIRCDGSFSQTSSLAGYGVVFTDSHGRVTSGYAGTIVCSDPLVAEAKALLIGLQAAAASDTPSSVKTDCLSLVEGLRKGVDHWPWQCAAWMHCMTDLLKTNTFLTVSFTPRRQNVMADRLAKAAASGTLPFDWLHCAYFTDPDCNVPFQPP